MVSVSLVFSVRFEPVWPAIMVASVTCDVGATPFMDVASLIDNRFILMICMKYLLPYVFR